MSVTSPASAESSPATTTADPEKSSRSDIIRGPSMPAARFASYVIFGDVCHLSAQVARSAGDGSLQDQTQAILEKIDATLAEAGTDKSRLLTAMIYCSNMWLLSELNLAWKAWVDSDHLPAGALLHIAHVPEDVLVQIQITAAMPQRQLAEIVNTPDAAAAVGPYSQGVRVENGTVYVSGCIGLLPGSSGMFAGPTIEEQTRQCLANMDAIVKASGATRIIKTTILLADMGDFAVVNELYRKYFGDGPVPARSTFAVKSLPKGALVEIEAIAV